MEHSSNFVNLKGIVVNHTEMAPTRYHNDVTDSRRLEGKGPAVNLSSWQNSFVGPYYLEKEKGVKQKNKKWRAWRESNSRPLVPETSALSTELQAHLA